MGWLSYSDDEVRSYHPAFERAANEALAKAGLQAAYKWIHHPPRRHADIFPDFVLTKKASGDWVLIVEIKRRRESVYSTRNQYQVKNYAESNANRYPRSRPKFFCITNLETTLLFALNGTRPPIECKVKGGLYESGSFKRDPEATHRALFIEHLAEICKTVISARRINYELVWPLVLDNLFTHMQNIRVAEDIPHTVPATPNWAIVQSFFGQPTELNAIRLFLLRCLIAEYLRGALRRVGHPRANLVPPLKSMPIRRIKSSVANTIDKLRTIDFLSFFEDFSPALYRRLSDPNLIGALQSYVKELVASNVAQLAIDRVDALELIDSLFTRFYPLPRLPLDGKIQTDPELADILVTLTIEDEPQLVYDPGCGAGTLLSAAFDRIVALGLNEEKALESLCGIDADDVSARIAALRLALKNPKMLTPDLKIKVDVGDVFCMPELVKRADVIVMNPPFKRYESQDDKPIPQALRDHYNLSIQSIDGKPAMTTGGQANLFNYYVEYIAKVAKPGTRVGIVLDNKWYHNLYGQNLRRLLLKDFEIQAIVEYPHHLYFKSYTIATSLLILKKVGHVDKSHPVRFVRCATDPQVAGAVNLAAAMHNRAAWPLDWHENEVPQGQLNYKTGWKIHFHGPFGNSFLHVLTPLSDLFEYSRRGSLNKEGGGTGVIDFPFDQKDYGPKRARLLGQIPPRPWQTRIVRELTKAENERIIKSTKKIPPSYRGWAIRNADDLNNYVLSVGDVKKVQTIEPPSLRSLRMFCSNKRVGWTSEHDRALTDMKSNPNVAPFITELENTVGLNESTIPREQIWVALREPYGGDLVIPRKMRAGHRVHLNTFVLKPSGRQVRISSNFVSYSNCLAVDQVSGLGRATAASLIAAFLVSSFGQVQFEREGYNREGVLAVEKEQLNRVRVLDPRSISQKNRARILAAFRKLPYPIPTDRLSGGQPERNKLDILFAEEICRAAKLPNAASILEEVHNSLDEWLEARQP